MARAFEERLAALRLAVEDPTAPASRAEMVAALRGSNGFLAAVVADGLTELDAGWEKLLVSAFERLLQDPAKRDPKCHGKIAIAKALYRADIERDEVYLAGIRHVQREPVWGGSVDTAAELRGVCVMALAYQGHPKAMIEAARLLADPERAARIAAAQAIGASGNREVGEPLLRLRIELPEVEAEVFGAYLGALLELAPRESLDIAAAHLVSLDDERADAAALALGSSRVEGAFEVLRDASQSMLASRRSVLLLAIALLRSNEAWTHLLEIVEKDSRESAVAALRALSTFKHDESLAARVREAVTHRSDADLEHSLAELFDS